MYSILLVDDEEAVMTSIRDFTPWSDYGFERPLLASNGLEALEIIEERIPDVIITDIKMPYLDGIELTKRIRENYSSTTQIVILSGFDEFTYAQEAVRLKVAEYVLKPVTVESMKALLGRIKNRIDEDKAKIEMMKNAPMYKEAFSLYKERFLASLLTGGDRKDEESLRIKAQDFDISVQSKLFAVAVMEREETPSFSAIIEKLSNEIESDNSLKTIIFQYENLLVLLFHTTMTDEFVGLFKKQIYRTLTLLKDSFAHYFDHVFHIGVGSVVKSLGGLNKSFDGALEALNYSMIDPEQYIIDEQDVKQVEKDFENSNIGGIKSELSFALKFGTQEDIEKEIHSYFMHPSMQKDMQSSILFVIGTITEVWHLYSDDLAELCDGGNIFTELSHIKSLSAGEKLCLNLALKTNKKAMGTREISKIEFVESAKKIIRKRYSDPLFGLDSLCEEIAVSPAYFSTTFKKETGISFVQFLTNTRIEKAKQLLANSDEKTYEIAEKVGFSEPNYFSFTFKKNVGLSPSQYRNKEKQ